MNYTYMLVLIFHYGYGSPAVTVPHYPTLASCRAAAIDAGKQNYQSLVDWVCVMEPKQ